MQVRREQEDEALPEEAPEEEIGMARRCLKRLKPRKKGGKGRCKKWAKK